MQQRGKTKQNTHNKKTTTSTTQQNKQNSNHIHRPNINNTQTTQQQKQQARTRTKIITHKRNIGRILYNRTNIKKKQNKQSQTHETTATYETTGQTHMNKPPQHHEQLQQQTINKHNNEKTSKTHNKQPQ